MQQHSARAKRWFHYGFRAHIVFGNALQRQSGHEFHYAMGSGKEGVWIPLASLIRDPLAEIVKWFQ
jgi:hypothetical protein